MCNVWEQKGAMLWPPSALSVKQRSNFLASIRSLNFASGTFTSKARVKTFVSPISARAHRQEPDAEPISCSIWIWP